MSTATTHYIEVTDQELATLISALEDFAEQQMAYYESNLDNLLGSIRENDNDYDTDMLARQYMEDGFKIGVAKNLVARLPKPNKELMMDLLEF